MKLLQFRGLSVAFALACLSTGLAAEQAAGGTGILVGDGNLTYGIEKILETYYDWQVWKSVHVALDFQFVENPAFNSDRGPVAVFGGRLHWEF